MKFGIEEINKKIFCANCGNLISNDGTFNENYCPRCGAPLSVQAITDFEANILKEQQDLIYNLKDISQKIGSSDLNLILEQLEDN